MADAYIAGMRSLFTPRERGYLQHLVANRVQCLIAADELDELEPHRFDVDEQSIGCAVIGKLADMRAEDRRVG